MPKNDISKEVGNPNRADEAVLSTQQAANQLGVSVRTIQLWVEAGILSGWKTAGNHRRIYQWSVDELIKSGKPNQSTHPNEAPGKPCILIVEDDRTTQTYYESMLHMLNIEHELIFAADGLEGLVSIGRHKPWLLLLDIQMPRMSGIEIVQSIRHQALTKDIALIIISNLEHSEAMDRGLPADCIFFKKPISLVDLSETITSLISENQSIIEKGER